MATKSVVVPRVAEIYLYLSRVCEETEKKNREYVTIVKTITAKNNIKLSHDTD